MILLAVVMRTVIYKSMKKGFTLIELLVVISIIGILAALTLTGFNAARKNARDAARKSDLGQYRTAVEAYASNNNGKYPLNCNVGPNCGHGESDTSSGIFQTSNGPLIPNYLPSIIHDPTETGGGGSCSGGQCLYRYRGVVDGMSYVLEAYLETGGAWQVCSNGKAGKVNCSVVTCADETCDL